MWSPTCWLLAARRLRASTSGTSTFEISNQISLGRRRVRSSYVRHLRTEFVRQRQRRRLRARTLGQFPALDGDEWMMQHERLVERVAWQGPRDAALNVGGGSEIFPPHNEIYAAIAIIDS